MSHVEKLSRDEIRRRIGLVPPDNQTSGAEWPEPKALPSKLAKVAQFDTEFLPPKLARWVADISERLQCPPDYVAITALTALGSLIGRRVGIKPQQKTDWLEVPNVWGAFIGKPGLLKSPAMMEALKPLHHLEAEAAKAHAAALVDHQAALTEFKLHKSIKESVLKDALKKKVADKVVSLDEVSSIKSMIKEAQTEDPLGLGAGPEEPKPIRYRTNDSSYEAIGALLVSNPAGLLVERDELISLLKHLDREEQCVARGFYLSGWAGNYPFLGFLGAKPLEVRTGHGLVPRGRVDAIGNLRSPSITGFPAGCVGSQVVELDQEIEPALQVVAIG